MFETGNVWAYVIAAYGVTWLTVMGYSVRLYILNRRAGAAADPGGDV